MRQDSSYLDRESGEPLTAREAAFVSAFVATRNATKAAETAGYSPKSAHVLGSRLLKKPRVAAAITVALKHIARKYDVTAERTVQEMATIGFSDIRHYTVDGKPITDWLGLTPDAPHTAMRAIKKIKRRPITVELRNADGKVMQVTSYEFEIEFWSKDTAIKHLGEYLKLFKEKRAEDDPDESISDDDLRNGVISILREAKKRRAAALEKQHST
ncbi:MAG: terminase small subunit [Gemmatimonadaceae bacterium]